MLFRTRKNAIIPAEEISNIKNSMILTRDELDDHLQSINDNTSELEIQNGYLCELDNRITKMEERMDELHFLLKQLVTQSRLSVELSKDEQRAFLIFYTHEKFMGLEKLSVKSGIEMAMLKEVLDSMMDKGIPLEREVLDGRVFFRLNDEFKLKQAKENIIAIDSDVTSQYQNQLLQQFFE